MIVCVLSWTGLALPRISHAIAIPAKGVLKCQLAIRKAADSLLVRHMKDLAFCADQVLKCVQTSCDSSELCLPKATAQCQAAIEKSRVMRRKLSDRVLDEKRCGSLDVATLLNADGLGSTPPKFSAEPSPATCRA
jgi:hypothetical protein